MSRVAVVINPASGSVGEDTAKAAQTILAEYGLKSALHLLAPDMVADQMRRAVDAAPDLVVVIAGDGTARCAAELAGPNGPLVAPLPGGTMNMLPRNLYGDRSWPQALSEILDSGIEIPVSGGEVDGRLFLVAAILGSPANWAKAREAVRQGRMGAALARAQRALHRAFTGRLRFSLDGGPVRKAEALTLMCPLVSRIMDAEEQALEATAVDPAGVADLIRLGFHAAVGDWRKSPAVTVGRCRQGAAWAGGGIPAVLDGEPLMLDRQVRIRFRPAAFRALIAPAP